MFSIPLNCYHRIVNASSARGAASLRHLGAEHDEPASTTASSSSTARTISPSASPAPTDYFKPNDDLEPDPVRGLAMRRTNFIPDIINADLPLDNRRSPGYRRMEPSMAGNRFYFWIGQHETGRYSKAHKHASAAVLICIKGKGYTYTWPATLGTQPWKDGQPTRSCARTTSRSAWCRRRR